MGVGIAPLLGELMWHWYSPVQAIWLEHPPERGDYLPRYVMEAAQLPTWVYAAEVWMSLVPTVLLGSTSKCVVNK